MNTRRRKKYTLTSGFTPTPNFMQSFISKLDVFLRRFLNREYRYLGRRGLRPQHKNWCRGFTLVEMLVSLALFAVVVTMSVSVLLILIDANGRAQSMQLVMTNLSFTLDSLTREVRTSFNWDCFASAGIPTVHTGTTLGDCVNANVFSIVESGNSITGGVTLDTRRITYWYDDDYYNVSPKQGAILRKIGNGTNPWVPLTGDDISIDVTKFIVSGTTRWVTMGGNQVQPTATIYIKGRAGFDTTGNTSKEKTFSLQTTVTQRLLDI